MPWLKTTSSPNIHPHSMVTCPWTAPVTDPKVCRPDQNLPYGWLRPLLRLLSSSTSPSVQSCFFHFTSVPQVLISTALPTSLLYPSQLGVVISGNPIQQQGCRQGVLLSISYGPYHHHSPQGHKCTWHNRTLFGCSGKEWRVRILKPCILLLPLFTKEPE